MRGRISTLLASFRVRLVLGYALVVAVVAGVWAWSLYGPLTQAAVDQQRSDLITVARIAALAVSDSTATPAADARALVAGSDLRATIIATDGTVLADSAQDPSKMENHAGRPEVAAALRGQVGFDTRTSATLGTAQMYVAVPATRQGLRVVMRVSEPLLAVQGLADRGRTTGLALLALALLAAVLVGVRLSATATAPVLRLRDAAEAMAGGDLDTAVPAASGELAELATALRSLRDRMHATIGELEDGQIALRAVIDGLEDAVFLFEGDRIEIANHAAGTLFRAPASGWRDLPLAAAGLPASLESAVRSRLACAAPCSGEVGPDPEARYFRVTALPLAGADAASRTLVVIADITEVSRLDAVRRDFVANASHELKTPVATISLLAEAAETAACDGDEEQAAQFVAQIRGEADRLRRLVVDLLDLSRIEAAPRPGEVANVRALASNAIAGHRPAAAAASLALELDDAAIAGQDVYAAADPTNVAIVLDNLLANAIAYTERGSVTLRLDADPAAVVIQVSDTGVGIGAEHLPRVFERFYRVDPARTRASGGTGLGLALVRNAVELSGGTVTVASEPERGTTFTVRLPRAL